MKLFSKVINRWKQKVKRYFFSYRNGFYELYMLANSPQLMLHNFANMPFVKHDTQYQTINTQNPFLRVKIFYLAFEEELLLMLSEAFYKKNVMDNMMYDEEQPSVHFFIALKVSNKKVISKYPLVNGTSYSHNMWSICKPAGIKNVCHFKNSNEQFYTLYFTQSWLDNYLKHADEKVKNFLNGFLESDTTYMMWPRYAKLGESDYSLFKDALEQSKPVSEIDQDVFRTQSLKMFEDFTSSIDKADFHADHLKMSNDHRLKILRAENYLAKFYSGEFPGLEQISDKIGISPTGLKTGFRQVYGCSIYQYFRSQKMKIALSILEQNKEIKIKDLAIQMGYESAAKFTAAFKEEIGVLPSEVNSAFKSFNISI